VGGMVCYSVTEMTLSSDALESAYCDDASRVVLHDRKIDHAVGRGGARYGRATFSVLDSLNPKTFS